MAIPTYMLRQLSFGLFVCSSLIMLSFNGWEMLEKVKDKRLHHVQEERKQRLKDMCQRDNKTFGRSGLVNDVVNNLLVDDTNGVIYCYIPKVACSNLKKFMVVLEKGEPYIDPILIQGFAHRTVLPIRRFHIAEAKAKLKHYTKFLFVRDPFVRLISAYRDKFERYNPVFYKTHGRTILRVSGSNPDPPKTLDEALALGIHITFHDFIQYLLDPRTRETKFESHWQQMYSLCHPCHIQYDFIGHQETFQEDMEQLLKALMLPGDIKILHSYRNVTTSDSVVDWFAAVSLEDRRKLYELYETDFKLFGYRKPDELFQG